MANPDDDPTSLTAASIVKEIRGHAHQLKELQKRNKPWDPNVEFQRQQIRRLQLQILFKFSGAKEAKELDNQLWMTTSHAFISSYKALLNSLDRERDGGNTKARPPRNVVERRRLVQRFRQFLTAEDKFWRMFVLRYINYFGLTDLKSVLLPVVGAEFDSNEDATERSIFPDGRDANSSSKKGDRELRVAIISKALVCIGDLSRYREQQGEMVGKSDHPNGSRGGRGGRHYQNGQTRQPTYSKSQELYESARSLNPDTGNASHQLAIISNYQKDTFCAVYHYYRALCVRHPFETASENLQTVLNKALDAYMSKGETTDEQLNSSLSPKAQVECLKEKVVLLHASFRLSPEEAIGRLGNVPSALILDFSSLVSDRSLSLDIMTRILVMGIGALWRIRMVRDVKAEKDANMTAEPRIVLHTLALMTALLRIGVLQVSDGSDTQSREPGQSMDLALNITAVFRRILPILRICSKWVRAHLSYLISLLPTSGNVVEEMKAAITDFWIAYQAFFTNLGRAFPLDNVPAITNPLEEDVDMTGFAPLKKMMMGAFAKAPNGLALGQSRAHPNEEHLMRISDLLQDAREVASDEKSPIFLNDNKFTFRAPEPPKAKAKSSPPKKSVKSVSSESPASMMIPPSVRSQALLQRSHAQAPLAEPIKEDVDDDNATVSTRTEDDPVHLAMHAVDRLSSDASDDMEEDEVLYPKQTINTPLRGFAAISPRLSAATPTLSPIGSRRGSNPLTATPRRLGFTPLPQHVTDTNWTNAVQPPLLFGSGTGDAPSIWSTTHDCSLSTNANTVSPPTIQPVQPSTFVPAVQTVIRSPTLPPVRDQPTVITPTDFDPPFQANSPSNFVGHNARASINMPPYGLIQPSLMSTYVSYSQPLRSEHTSQTVFADPYQLPRQQRDWVPPP